MTLTQTAILTKQVITISVITLILGIISFIGYKIWYSYYLSTLPPVEEKPDTKFGILPTPAFPSSSVSSSNFSYTLDTTTGSLPKLGDPGFEKVIKVFFIISPFASFLSPDRSQALASKFGIGNFPQVLSETSYSFEDRGRILTVNLDNGNFTYVNKEATNSGIERLDDSEKLISDFKETLNTLAIFKEELREGRSKVITKVSPTFSAQLSLWQKNVNGKQIFTQDFNKALVNADILGSARSLEKYSSLNFTFWQVDENTFATYHTKFPADALNDLKSGKGTIIIEPPKPQVSITSVYLGYFLSDNYSQYLQPIYIFEGPQFVAYVSAIRF